jgi:hypothetical protein
MKGYAFHFRQFNIDMQNAANLEYYSELAAFLKDLTMRKIQV